LGAASVGTTQLQTDAVTTVKITNANVTGAKISTGGVSTTQMADDAITAAKIANLDPDDYTGLTSSQASVTFANNLIFKHGVVTVAGSTTEDVTYTTAFPNSADTAQATIKATTASLSHAAYANPKSGSTTSILQITNCTTQSQDIYWQAWGY